MLHFQAMHVSRIKGEIVDFLRKNSNLCRTTIVNKQKYENIEKLQKNLNRDPHDMS